MVATPYEYCLNVLIEIEIWDWRNEIPHAKDCTISRGWDLGDVIHWYTDCVSALQCIAVLCSELQWVTVSCSALQCVAVSSWWCDTLIHWLCERTAVYCSMLQWVTVSYTELHWVAVCCSALQCCVVLCSVLQCVAVCCSASQYVAVRCSVLLCVALCSSQKDVLCRDLQWLVGLI